MERGETTTGVDPEGTMKCRGSVGNRVVISQLVLPLRSMDRVIFRLVLSPPPSPPPPPLFPLSVSIEGELAPCLEPSGYLFNIVTNEALGEVGEIDDARGRSVGRSASIPFA